MTTNTNNTNTVTVTTESATPLRDLIEARKRREVVLREEALAAAFNWTERVGVRLEAQHFRDCLNDRPHLSIPDRVALVAYRTEVLTAGLEVAA